MGGRVHEMDADEGQQDRDPLQCRAERHATGLHQDTRMHSGHSVTCASFSEVSFLDFLWLRAILTRYSTRTWLEREMPSHRSCKVKYSPDQRLPVDSLIQVDDFSADSAGM